MVSVTSAKHAMLELPPMNIESSVAERAMSDEQLKSLLAECLEVAENWPGVAYTDDLRQRITAAIAARNGAGEDAIYQYRRKTEKRWTEIPAAQMEYALDRPEQFETRTLFAHPSPTLAERYFMAEQATSNDRRFRAKNSTCGLSRCRAAAATTAVTDGRLSRIGLIQCRITSTSIRLLASEMHWFLARLFGSIIIDGREIVLYPWRRRPKAAPPPQPSPPSTDAPPAPPAAR